MARIPVEKNEGGRAWWKWLVGLLVIATLIWLLLEFMDPDKEGLGPEDETNTESMEPVPGGAGAVEP